MRRAIAEQSMTGDVVALGLGAQLADPDSIWPDVTVIEVIPEVAQKLGARPGVTVCAAIAAQAGVSEEVIGPIGVTITPNGGALVRVGSLSSAARALDVAARRRATNAAEALHAAILALTAHQATSR